MVLRDIVTCMLLVIAFVTRIKVELPGKQAMLL